jgi:hypothetical protein
MPTFCRHNRFIERCPICSKTLLEQSPTARPRAARKGAGARRRRGAGPAAPREQALRVRREVRAADDGFRSPLAAGLRASDDAYRLAAEVAFSSGRLLALAADPPGLYGEARALAGEDLELATWICVLTAYLAPLQGDDPFAGIRLALARSGEGGAPHVPDLSEVPLGPRSSHDTARGGETLAAYLQWAERTGGTAEDGGHGAGAQARALTGDRSWSAERRFERLFERLALPGLSRAARYELLVTLGRLGLYVLRPDSLHLGGGRIGAHDDATLAGAKRVFGIADPLLLERRSAALAEEAGVPLEALDLALANWVSTERATAGFPPDTADEAALEGVGGALGI